MSSPCCCLPYELFGEHAPSCEVLVKSGGKRPAVPERAAVTIEAAMAERELFVLPLVTSWDLIYALETSLQNLAHAVVREESIDVRRHTAAALRLLRRCGGGKLRDQLAAEQTRRAERERGPE